MNDKSETTYLAAVNDFLKAHGNSWAQEATGPSGKISDLVSKTVDALDKIPSTIAILNKTLDILINDAKHLTQGPGKVIGMDSAPIAEQNIRPE